MNKKRELRNNINANNYKCLLKRMFYCPSNGQELLSALAVTLVCHASNVFLVLKVPLSKIDAFSNVGPGVISNSRTFGRSFGVSQMFFFSGIKSSAGFPNITPRTICTGNCIHDIGLRFYRRSEFRSWELLLYSGKYFVYDCDVVFF